MLRASTPAPATTLRERGPAAAEPNAVRLRPRP